MRTAMVVAGHFAGFGAVVGAGVACGMGVWELGVRVRLSGDAMGSGELRVMRAWRDAADETRSCRSRAVFVIWEV